MIRHCEPTSTPSVVVLIVNWKRAKPTTNQKPVLRYLNAPRVGSCCCALLLLPRLNNTLTKWLVSSLATPHFCSDIYVARCCLDLLVVVGVFACFPFLPTLAPLRASVTLDCATFWFVSFACLQLSVLWWLLQRCCAYIDAVSGCCSFLYFSTYCQSSLVMLPLLLLLLLLTTAGGAKLNNVSNFNKMCVCMLSFFCFQLPFFIKISPLCAAFFSLCFLRLLSLLFLLLNVSIHILTNNFLLFVILFIFVFLCLLNFSLFALCSALWLPSNFPHSLVNRSHLPALSSCSYSLRVYVWKFRQLFFFGTTCANF